MGSNLIVLLTLWETDPFFNNYVKNLQENLQDVSGIWCLIILIKIGVDNFIFYLYVY